MTPVEDWVRLRERSIRYFHAGTGPPLLLVHGIGASADWWLPNYQDLSARFTTYALDLPGSGESGPLIEADVQSPAAVLQEFLDALAIEHTALVGHSLGGYVAGSFAAIEPQRITSLVLVDSAGFGSLRHPLLRLMAVPRLGELMMKTPGIAVDLFINTLIRWRSRESIPRWLRVRTKEYFHRPGFARDFLRTLRSGIDPTGSWTKRPLLGPLLAPLQLPLLVLWGIDDPVFPSDQACVVRQSLPRADVEVVPAPAGHVPQLLARAAVTGRLVTFLEKRARVAAVSS